MNVSQLRRAITDQIKPSRTANGKPVYTLPNGHIISKARKGDLEAYLSDLDMARQQNELEWLIGRCNNRIRRYSKRRPLPNNFKLLIMWTERRNNYVCQVGALMAEVA